jgi:hypothetical protein
MVALRVMIAIVLVRISLVTMLALDSPSGN